jgi:hypothetical protein
MNPEEAQEILKVLQKIEAHLAVIASLVKDSRWGPYIVTTDLNPK